MQKKVNKTTARAKIVNMCACKRTKCLRSDWSIKVQFWKYCALHVHVVLSDKNETKENKKNLFW